MAGNSDFAKILRHFNPGFSKTKSDRKFYFFLHCDLWSVRHCDINADPLHFPFYYPMGRKGFASRKARSGYPKIVASASDFL